jgi:hypothetical protein
VSGGQSNVDVEMSTTLRVLDSIKHVLDRDRGIPGSPYRRMLVEGEIARASRETGELPEPLALSPGQESASTVLGRLRSDER